MSQIPGFTGEKIRSLEKTLQAHCKSNRDQSAAGKKHDTDLPDGLIGAMRIQADCGLQRNKAGELNQ